MSEENVALLQRGLRGVRPWRCGGGAEERLEPDRCGLEPRYRSDTRRGRSPRHRRRERTSSTRDLFEGFDQFRAEPLAFEDLGDDGRPGHAPATRVGARAAALSLIRPSPRSGPTARWQSREHARLPHAAPRPSKPPGLRSRRCRRRTSKSCARSARRSITATGRHGSPTITPTSCGPTRPRPPVEEPIAALAMFAAPWRSSSRPGMTGRSRSMPLRLSGRDRVLMRGRSVFAGRASGFPVEDPVFQLFDLEDGRVRRVQTFRSTPEALEAAGLEE